MRILLVWRLVLESQPWFVGFLCLFLTSWDASIKKAISLGCVFEYRFEVEVLEALSYGWEEEVEGVRGQN